MASTLEPPTPIALAPGQGEALWFFGGLITIKSSAASTGGRVTVTENLMPHGTGSPLHVHRREDEWFYVLDGELTVWVDGRIVVAPAGAFVFGPRDLPHTFTVSSGTARFLLVTEPGGFDEFVRAVGRSAERPEMPAPTSEPPDVAALTELAAGFGLEIIGPPGIPG
jgi:mannose-6-phosphate isomerase-like protein (cupin superfamily)